ncbi:MAG: branched-chain amino acid ABC transporter permease, partial [candidate division Zixibacteria bacterium]|nr:branched-chain amino acid ABC transporter permease [candidate division Zixibacteria bacterium]
IDTEVKFYFMVMIILSIIVFGTRNLFRTKIGRSFIAIRDRDLSAELIGINIAKYKIISFAISSFYAGIAGCLFAHYSNYITPENFNIAVSIEYLAMIIMGGLGTIVGTLFGAMFITLIPEGIRMITDLLGNYYPMLAARFADFRLGTFGLIIVCFLILEPTGLYGIWNN